MAVQEYGNSISNGDHFLFLDPSQLGNRSADDDETWYL